MRLVELLDAVAAALVGGVAVRQPARNRTCCVEEHRPELVTDCLAVTDCLPVSTVARLS